MPSEEICNVPAAAMLASTESIIIVDANAPAVNVETHKWHPNTPDGQGTPFLFHHGKSASDAPGGAIMRMLKMPSSAAEECQFPHAIAFSASGIQSSAVVAITSDEEVITGM